jgi:ribonuclease-3
LTKAADWARNKLGYQFSSSQLLDQALTHRSAGTSHNERLEFLGDAVLGLVIARALFQAKPDAREGTLSRYRARLVRRDTLAALARELDLGSQLRMGGGEQRSGGHQRASVLADTLEALFGAILLHGGFAAAEAVILAVYADRLAQLPAESELVDAKTALQEYLQSRGLAPPLYTLEETTGAAHAQTFTAGCCIETMNLRTNGVGQSRRQAEQRAAAAALDKLQHDH